MTLRTTVCTSKNTLVFGKQLIIFIVDPDSKLLSEIQI